MNVLVAGGAGYIGSHTCVALIDAGYTVTVIDSLVNSEISSIDGIQKITAKKIDFIEQDIRDVKSLNAELSGRKVGAVINFAGYKAVGESVENPISYYDNNINCAISLLKCMVENRIKLFIFSSSATVYGDPCSLPVNEGAAVYPSNPYGKTKLFIENLILDVAESDHSWKAANLRYFNPVGAHPSGLIGEKPGGTPNNLMPYIAQVAAGQQSKLKVFGKDYDTPDGTGVRDYIHVMDLAAGHVSALQKLSKLNEGKVLTLNLGTGTGYSVLEMIEAFENVSGRKIPFEFSARRTGDVASCYADPGLAAREINWTAKLDLSDMCRDTWNFQSRHAGLGNVR